MKWRPYSEYRDSGFKWLGVMPRHWRIQKLKFNSYIKGRIGWQNLRSDEFIDEGPYLVTGMHFGDGGVDWDACYHISEERYLIAPEIFVREGDILITKDGSIGKLAYINHLPGKASLNSHLLIIRPLKGDYQPRFLYHLLGSERFQRFILIEQKGTTFYGITQESVECFPALLPSLPEQRVIAAFLDRETERIDTLIAKKERQIELLKEKRAALISHAVTAGLPFPGKTSPKEKWIEARLGRFIRLQRGFDITGADERDEGFPVISSGGVSGYSDVAMVRGPGVIVGRKGTLGTVYYQETDYWPHDTTLWVKEFGGNVPKFVYYYLIHLRLEGFDVGAANPTLNRNHVHPLLVSFPDPDSQSRIAQYLDGAIARIDAMVNKIQASIALLLEHRSAVISAAVTGKIDVRQEVT